MRNYIRKMRIRHALLSGLPAANALGQVVFSGVDHSFGSQFFVDICGALNLFVKVARIRSDAF
jgi:hypothetical protein